MWTIHDYGQGELGTRRDAEFDGRCNVVLIEVKGFNVISTNLYLTGRVYPSASCITLGYHFQVVFEFHY